MSQAAKKTFPGSRQKREKAPRGAGSQEPNVSQPNLYAVTVSRISDGVHQSPEIMRAHTIFATPDGTLSIESEVGGLTLSGGLWDSLEVKRLQ
jgi:hypothetical protein